MATPDFRRAQFANRSADVSSALGRRKSGVVGMDANLAGNSRSGGHPWLP